jgi:hypothetical protein
LHDAQEYDVPVRRAVSFSGSANMTSRPSRRCGTQSSQMAESPSVRKSQIIITAFPAHRRQDQPATRGPWSTNLFHIDFS